MNEQVLDSVLQDGEGLFGLNKGWGRKSRTRNTLVSNLWLRTQYVEKLGSGFLRINKAADSVGLPKAEVNFDDVSFSLELSGVLLSQMTQEMTQERLDLRILKYIKENPKVTVDVLASEFSKSDSTIKRYLSRLKQEGKIIRVGSTKSGFWQVVKTLDN